VKLSWKVLFNRAGFWFLSLVLVRCFVQYGLAIDFVNWNYCKEYPVVWLVSDLFFALIYTSRYAGLLRVVMSSSFKFPLEVN
jgi:hypothetical protein